MKLDSTIVAAGTALVVNFITRGDLGPGKTLADIWDVILGNYFHALNEKSKAKYQEKIDDFKKTLGEKIVSIPEDQVQDPKMSIVGPALEASKYYFDEKEIREMFSNLIASSMNSTYNGIVQHSFVEIIKQLSPYDARLFASLDNNEAIIDIILENDKGHYHRLVTEFFISDSFSDYTQNSISLINLEKQGLIKIFYDLHLTNDLYYSKYENSTYYKEIKNKSWGPVDNLRSKVSMKKYKFEVTPLGKAFKEICVKDSL